MDDQVLPVKFKSIHINPKFRNAHINPSFFTKPPTIASNIHVNPKFLALPAVDALPPNPPDVPKPPPIYKTRRKLIRNVVKPPVRGPQVPSTRLVKISKNKLIRTSNVGATPKKSLPGSGRKNLYKIDRRIPTKVLTPQNQRKLRKCFTPKIVTTTNRKLMRIGTSFVSYSPQKISRVFSEKPSSSIANHSKNRKLHFLNINGVLYKSTANKLQKSSPSTVPKAPVSSKKTQDRVLFIRGEKFTVDGNGKRLRKSNTTTTSSLKLSRIHFAGLTYTANKNGTYERTNSHFARTHLSIAKQRSISFLANKMVKSNLPCLIYRRLGKCLARERGRCHRVHDPEQVAVCRKFLKGACKDPKCLLAHKADLSKMPTCKFFLEGCCTAADCPYLHKKLNEKTEICRDFLQGFCKLAEKCSKRHDLICPNIEKNGVCDKLRCPFPHPQKKVKNLSEIIPKPPNVVPKDVRYFMDTHECDDEVELSEEGQERLARTLAKVNKMKRNYWNNGETSGENNCAKVPKNISSESVESIIVTSVLFSRPPIGDLPHFIPL